MRAAVRYFERFLVATAADEASGISWPMRQVVVEALRELSVDA